MMNGDHRTSRRPRRRRHGRSSLPLLLVIAAGVVLVVGGSAFAWNRFGGSDGDEPPAAGTTSPPSPRASSSAAPLASPRPVASSTPAPRPHIVADPQPVPILVYHHVVARPKGPPLVVMSTKRFRAQLAWLAAHGYEAVTLRRVYDAWTGEGTLPPRPVVLTFDDGYADQVRNAAPMLRDYGWPAELDLVSSALYLGDDPPGASLTPDMVQSLLDDGWGLQSHSVSHADLTRLHGAKLRRELRQSRARLEQLFAVPVDFFCYPGGIYTKRVKIAVRNAGYLAATGTRFGAATPRDLYSLPRVYCYAGESMSDFSERLRRVMAAESD